MTRLLLLSLLMVLPFIASAQTTTVLAPDRLIFKTGFEIQCRVVSTTDTQYEVDIPDNNGEPLILFYEKKDVKSIDYDYFLPERIEARELSEQARIAQRKEGGFRFRFNVGYSHRTGKVEDDRISNFRSGYILGASPGFAIGGSPIELGVTADYRRHTYNYSYWGAYKIKINTYFIGPYFLFLENSRNKESYYGFELAAGYVHYNEILDSGQGGSLGKANTAGVKTTFVYGFPAGERRTSAIELRLAFFLSNFKKSKHGNTTVTYDEPQNISSVNFSVGFTLGK